MMIRTDNTAVQSFNKTLGYEVEIRTVMAKWLEPSARPECWVRHCPLIIGHWLPNL